MEKVKVFISYSHEDEDMKVQLEKQLIMLKRSGKIDVWQDRAILPGQEWNEEIIRELHNADLILLLISVDFNNSSYIWEKELKVAMQRHDAKQARVVPIILRKCDWSLFDYARLQALPKNATPVKSYADTDEAYYEIAVALNQLVDVMLKSA
jgi:hypothetical protein